MGQKLSKPDTMRVKPLIINWVNPRPGLSGGIKSNRLIDEAMVRRGHVVNILYIDGPPKVPRWWRLRSFYKYFKHQRMTINKEQHHLESSTANLIAVKHAKPIVAEDAPDSDVTIATWWETANWIKDWPDSKGMKAYFIRHHELHGGDEDLVKLTYRLPFKKLVIANWLKTLMAENYDDYEAALIPNGVDRHQFNFQPRSKQLVPTVGLLYGPVKWKGAETAFKSLKLVQEIIPSLRVICFGSCAINAHHNLPKNFNFFLRPSQDLIPKLYKQTDCWLMPSTSEGFGMPGLEAAACGCPIVSTLCGGPEDYVKNGHNGFLVPVGNIEKIAEAILRIVNLADEQWVAMSEASAEYSKKFDWDISAKKLEDAILEEIDEYR